MSWKRWLVPLAAIPVIALLAYGLTRDARTVPSTLPGRPAPEFALQTLQGDTLRLSDLRGQVVLVNFWASWCLACIGEHRLLVAADEEYRDDGLRIVGVVYQDSRENARRWMREMGGDWPNVLDRRSRTAIAYGVAGVPESFLITRDGQVAYKQIGPVTPDVLTRRIPDLLARTGGSAATADGDLPVGRAPGHTTGAPELPAARSGDAATER